MVDTSQLEQEMANLTTQVAETEAGEASAVVLINTFHDQQLAAVTAALAADNAADDAKIAAVTTAMAAVRDRFVASAAPLAAAVAANPPAQ